MVQGASTQKHFQSLKDRTNCNPEFTSAELTAVLQMATIEQVMNFVSQFNY